MFTAAAAAFLLAAMLAVPPAPVSTPVSERLTAMAVALVCTSPDTARRASAVAATATCTRVVRLSRKRLLSPTSDDGAADPSTSRRASVAANSRAISGMGGAGRAELIGS